MRFADGELAQHEHDFVAGLIAAHPDATSSIKAYVFTRERLADVYDVALNVPAELIDRCLPVANVQRSRSRLPGGRLTAMALAASLAVLIGGAAGWLLRATTHPNVASYMGIAPPGLQHALETTLAGKVAPISGAVSVRLVSTFASRDRRWCRQYALRNGEEERAGGIACRHADGWQIVVQVDLAEASTAPTPDGVHIPAAGDAIIAAYASEIMGGDSALGQDDEERLIRNERWMRAPEGDHPR
jgi:hypothetical protein